MRTLLFVLVLAGTTAVAQKKNPIEALEGAWQYQHGDTIETLIIANRTFAEAVYSLKGKQFYLTAGGTWSIQNWHFRKAYEFHSSTPELVGETRSFYLHNEVEGKLGVVDETNQRKKEFVLLDSGTPGKLAGAWLITGRMQGGEMQSITPGERRTMKILSGTRFQWIAYNTETRQFFGTGGGTYTTVNGKYTENLEFFSRDNTRVGSNLQFDFVIENGNWRHKGLSSKGDPIDEVWTKREKIKL